MVRGPIRVCLQARKQARYGGHNAGHGGHNAGHGGPPKPLAPTSLRMPDDLVRELRHWLS